MKWTSQRQQNAAYYTQLLSGIEQVKVPAIRPNTSHTFHLYVVRVSQRDALAAFLKEKGIETSIHYPVALPFLKAYNYLQNKTADFPIAYSYQDEILSLPMYPELTNEMMNYVANSINEFYA